MRLFFYLITWQVEREHPGRYHNSRTVWRVVGRIRATNRRQALEKAAAIVGIGNVRVRPLEDAR